MAADYELAAHVVELATGAGATQAEVTHVVAERFSTEARGAEIVKLEESVGRSIALRLFVRGGKASLGTTDLSPGGLRALVAETVDAARFVEADPNAGLPEGVAAGGEEDGLAMYAGDARDRRPELKLEDALALERTVRELDSRIVNSSGSRVADTSLSLALVNSLGFAGSYRASQVSLGTSPVAADGIQKRTGSYGTAARSYAGLLPVSFVAAEAVKRTVGMIGARKPETMRCPVIFERDVAALVLADLFAAISAANVAIGNSFLAGKTGERVGSELVTIVDDGRLPGGLGSSPFDAEGVPTRRNVVIENGRLCTFLYDTYYARRLGAASTGNASGGSVGPNNFFLQPGSQSLAELVAATPRGVLVVDTIGFSTESVTGTYSRGARGYLIEGGELAYPIDEFTIAGNLLEMFGAVDAVASDLIFDLPIASPSFRVAQMTVSGS